jgi:hypothetical protein
MLTSGRYSTGQIDSQWTDEIKTAFLLWLEQNTKEPRLTRSQVDAFMEKRTW